MKKLDDSVVLVEQQSVELVEIGWEFAHRAATARP
jgi:hypothetical protein